MINKELKNKDCIQINKRYIDNMGELAYKNLIAYKIFMFLIKYMDNNNALCVSVKTLAETFGVSTRTVMRSTSYLKNNGWIYVVKLGTNNVYVINPDIVRTPNYESELIKDG